MIKATLEFDIVDPEARKAHLRAILADEMALALLDFANYTRNELKYKDQPDNLEEARKNFFSILESRGIDLDVLLE